MCAPVNQRVCQHTSWILTKQGPTDCRRCWSSQMCQGQRERQAKRVTRHHCINWNQTACPRRGCSPLADQSTVAGWRAPFDWLPPGRLTRLPGSGRGRRDSHRWRRSPMSSLRHRRLVPRCCSDRQIQHGLGRTGEGVHLCCGNLSRPDWRERSLWQRRHSFLRPHCSPNEQEKGPEKKEIGKSYKEKALV